MFKRFLVLDLFHSTDKLDVKEWVDVTKEMPKEPTGIYKVRLKNEDEITAYFCQDRCITMMGYYKDKTSYWWGKKDKSPLDGVTHWGKTE